MKCSVVIPPKKKLKPVSVPPRQTQATAHSIEVDTKAINLLTYDY